MTTLIPKFDLMNGGLTPTGAVNRPINEKLAESVSVKDFGAVGDGVNNDATAIQAAINAVSFSGGGSVYFPTGTYLVNTSLTVPSYISLIGANVRKSVILQNFNGDIISSFGGHSSIQRMSLNANGKTGRGVVFSTFSPNSLFLNMEITGCSSHCVEFPADCGSTFKAIACSFYTTGDTATIAAIKLNEDTSATSRHFTDCEGGGCTLYDFGGCDDAYISGGYTRTLIFGANASKVMIVNLRVGNLVPVNINGGSHQIRNCVFANSVVINGKNIMFECEAAGYDITDNGTGNSISIPLRPYTPTWTASSVNPSLGNGVLTGTYSRVNKLITVQISLTFGSTTTTGTGDWAFSLPRADYAFITQIGGCGFTTSTSSSTSALFTAAVSPGDSKVFLYYIDTSGTLRNVGSALPATWGANSTVRFSLSYYTT